MSRAKRKASASIFSKTDPENQPALITLLLALTDRFSKGYGVSDTQANQLLARIKGEYERAYYAGILAERRAKAKLAQGHPGRRSLRL